MAGGTAGQHVSETAKEPVQKTPVRGTELSAFSASVKILQVAEAVMDIDRSSQSHRTDAGRRRHVRILSGQNLKGQVVQKVEVQQEISFARMSFQHESFHRKSQLKMMKDYR